MDSEVLDCSICFNRFHGKIFLCETGHSFCGDCSKLMRNCPKCNRPMTTKRSYDLESLVAELNRNVKLCCKNNGCTYKLIMDEQNSHDLECKYRMHVCQGAVFSKWNCNWLGPYEDILKHYKNKHPNNCRMSAVTKAILITPVFQNYTDTQLLPFLDGKQIFYYKHKVDMTAGFAYWVFQFAGPANEARKYSYEFEINKEHNKFKINGVCTADSENCDQLMDEQNCVCLTLKQLKQYVDSNGDINVRFRISNINFVPSSNERKSNTEVPNKKKIIYNK